jgi:hypothetical protein
MKTESSKGDTNYPKWNYETRGVRYKYKYIKSGLSKVHATMRRENLDSPEVGFWGGVPTRGLPGRAGGTDVSPLLAAVTLFVGVLVNS